MQDRAPSFSWLSLALCTLAGCSGGGSGSESGVLRVISSNLIPEGTRPINAPIEWTFDREIVLSSVSLASVTIAALPSAVVGAPVAGPVQGSFSLKAGSGDRTLVFQPLCPWDPAMQTGGLIPGNLFGPVDYQTTIFAGTQAPAQPLRAKDGATLGESFSVKFRTSSTPGWPFADDNPAGSPQVVDAESLPLTLELNLALRPMAPLTVTLDQSVLPWTVSETSIRLEFTDPGSGQPVSIPCQVLLTENCQSSGRATLQVIPYGVLPPATAVRFFLSGELCGLGFDDCGGIDALFHTALVEDRAAIPQPDAFFESFDDTQQWEPSAPLLEAPAVWAAGRLEAAEVFPGAGAVDIEIGPGTANGVNVVFSTEGGTLRDTNGNLVACPGGVIDARHFTIKSPVTKKSRFIGTGSLPLVIRCTGNFTVEAGAWLSVDGQDAEDVSGLMTAHIPQPGGAGQCSGGDGGRGSPATTESDARGEDGRGPFQEPGGGGRAGNSAYGSGANNNLISGGGGGGNWGIEERDPAQNGAWVRFCYSKPDCSLAGCPLPPALPPLACGDPGCNGLSVSNSSQGEAGNPGNQCLNQAVGNYFCDLGGTNGKVCQLDAVTVLCHAQGGAPGPAVFVDGVVRNDFCGRKPFLQNSTLSVLDGELAALQGGQGGGAAGDAVPSKNFPSGVNFSTTDFKGGAGGGGGGVLIVQALGTITVHGEITANGGAGGTGELDFVGSPAVGGGGGGAGGIVSLEAASGLFFGKLAVISAQGGNRGKGGMTIPGQIAGTGSLCRGNTSAGRGGAGGKGLTILHAPFDASSAVACGGESQPAVRAGAVLVENSNSSTQSVACEQDAFLTALFDPDPHILTPSFGAASSALSKWYSTGQAWVAGPPSFQFQGLDANGFVTNAPGAMLASGTGAVASSAHAVTLHSPLLAQMVAAEPLILRGDEFRPNTPASSSFTIVDAAASENLVSITTDLSQGAIPTTGNWEIRRLHLRSLVDGSPAPLPSSVSARILFEGAQEIAPGVPSPDPTTLIGPTADPSLLLGSRLFRFRVLFDRNPSALPLSPSLPRPGLDSLKTLYFF